MKKLFLIFSALVALQINAQDVIVKKDGSTILSKVIEVNVEDVKYKKLSNPDGPTYSILKAEIMSINYENGDKDSFVDFTTPFEEKNEDNKGYVEMKADKNNDYIIELYNRIYKPTKKVKIDNNSSSSCIIIFGVDSSSIMSNEDIEMKFIREKVKNPDGISEDCYYINLKNKTDRTIYIDKGNCFRLNTKGEAFCYFSNEEQTTVSNGNESDAYVNLGRVFGGGSFSGINVGGGSSQSVSTTYMKQRIIAIPPRGNVNLTQDKAIERKKYITLYEKPRYIENSERFYLYNETDSKTIGLTRGIVKRGRFKTFNQNELNWKREYYITYSKDDNFQSYSNLYAKLFIHEIIGSQEYIEDPIKLGRSSNSEKCIEDINEYTINGGLFLQK